MTTDIPLPAGLPLDAASWARTPLVVRHLVVQLLTVIQQQAGQIAAFEARVSKHSQIPIVRPLPIHRMRNIQSALAGRVNRAPDRGILGIAKHGWNLPRSSRSRLRPVHVGSGSFPRQRPTIRTNSLSCPRATCK